VVKSRWSCFADQLDVCVMACGSAHRCLLCLQITRGLLQKYGAERVRDTPITEVSQASFCTANKLRMGAVKHHGTVP
jgi:hypothetical protein